MQKRNIAHKIFLWTIPWFCECFNGQLELIMLYSFPFFSVLRLFENLQLELGCCVFPLANERKKKCFLCAPNDWLLVWVCRWTVNFDRVIVSFSRLAHFAIEKAGVICALHKMQYQFTYFFSLQVLFDWNWNTNQIWHKITVDFYFVRIAFNARRLNRQLNIQRI